MEVGVGDFITSFDKFKDVPAHVIGLKLEMGKAFCHQSKWRERWRIGVMLVAAHLLEREWQQDAITASMGANIAAGGSVSPPSGSDDDFKLTTYGGQYLQMRDIIPSFGIPIR